MSAEGEVRWLPIAQVARMTGLSDETIRKYCIAAHKAHFPSARMVDERWEIPEDEARAAKIVDRSWILARTGLTEHRLTQLERLGKLACSGEGKFSVSQEVYLHGVRGAEDPASVPPFEEHSGRSATTGTNHVGGEASNGTAGTTAASGSGQGLPNPGGQDAPREDRQVAAVVLVRPGVPLMKDFVEYMTEHKDPARLADEFFAGRYAPAYMPPVGVEYHVALGPGPSDDDGPTGTWVRRYPRWTYDGKKLACEGEVEFFVEDLVCERGTIPEQYAESSATYRLLEGLWNARATEARGRLRDKARIARVAFLPDFVWRPDVRKCLRRYTDERLHPSEFPDSVKVDLVDVPFIPTYNMFFFESTGEVRLYADRGEYTVISRSPGVSDEFGWGGDLNPDAPLPSQLMWPGRHAKGEVPPWYLEANAEYVAGKAAWDDMQREGRRLRARRGE